MPLLKQKKTLKMLRFIQSLRQEFKAAFAEPAPFEIKPAQGLSVLPMRVVKVKHKPQGKASDMYEIEVQKNRDGKAVSGTFGFHTATAMRQNEGSVPELTGWDIDALKRGEKPLVGDQRSVRGRTTNTNNAKAKVYRTSQSGLLNPCPTSTSASPAADPPGRIGSAAGT